GDRHTHRIGVRRRAGGVVVQVLVAGGEGGHAGGQGQRGGTLARPPGDDHRVGVQGPGVGDRPEEGQVADVVDRPRLQGDRRRGQVVQRRRGTGGGRSAVIVCDGDTDRVVVRRRAGRVVVQVLVRGSEGGNTGVQIQRGGTLPRPPGDDHRVGLQGPGVVD